MLVIIYNKYCYDPDKFKSECTHGILHFISMIGHLFIIFLRIFTF